MKRPYCDGLVWIAGIRPPDRNLSGERAIAVSLACCGHAFGTRHWAAWWEEPFAFELGWSFAPQRFTSWVICETDQ